MRVGVKGRGTVELRRKGVGMEKFRQSVIGERMNKLTGVRAIMLDIMETLRTAGSRKFINLSPGNPLILPEIEKMWRDATLELMQSDEFGKVVCRYGASQGYEPLIEAVVQDFNSRYGLSIGAANVLITPGSQSLYFYAANSFGGYDSNGNIRRVVLPLCPDYTGYGGVSLHAEAVISFKSLLDIDEKGHRFKYRLDLDSLKIDESTGCVVFSRPCNPTGNVMSADEVSQIAALARRVGAPVFVDSAYGPPYPALHFTEMTPSFEEPIVHCMSLSKAGLPGERIGIAIGDPAVLRVLESFQSNACIHSPRFGQAILARAIRSGKLAEMSRSVIQPFYKNKFHILEEAFDKELPASVPWYLHRGEGAMFAWLWFKDLPIADTELYQRLKALGLLVVPGSTFFPGLSVPWDHARQCIRLSLTAPDAELLEAANLLGTTLCSVYGR